MRKNFFFYMSILLLLLSVFGFSDNLFFDVRQESNSDPKFVIHGLFFLAWFILLVIQSANVRRRNIKAHIALGTTTMLVGLGVVLSTFFVFIAVYEGWDKMPFQVKANRLLTTTFAVFLLLSYLKRKRPVLHKRYIYVGTVYVMSPVLDRVGGFLGLNSLLQFAIFELVVFLLLFIALFVYDKFVLGKIHPISWISCLWFFTIWALAFFVL